MSIWIFACLLLMVDYCLLMIFYFAGWIRTPSVTASPSFARKTHVSVIIAARNEEKNIDQCLRSVLQQDYPEELFEVIVVDDHSDDDTFRLVKNISAKNLRLLELQDHLKPGNSSFKKQAIATGVAVASGELIITTDADCIVGKTWLSVIAEYYAKHQPAMIAGPVAFADGDSFLQKWQSLDLCGMMAITAGAIKNGFPNMCNGANLAYSKKIFEEVEGFSGIDNKPSGDDVMLMMKVAKKYPRGVHFLKAKDAIVTTQAVSNIPDLFQQRLRWLSKGTAFPDWRVSAVLVWSWLFNLSILINFMGGFFQIELMAVAAVSIFIKTIAELPLLWSGCSFFEKRKLLWIILPAQFIHIMYVVTAGSASRFGRFRWKGRRYGSF